MARGRSSGREDVRLDVDEAVTGTLMYVDRVPSTNKKYGDQIKLVIADEAAEGDEVNVWVTMRIGELLMGHGLITQEVSSQGNEYLKVVEGDPIITVGAEKGSRGSKTYYVEDAKGNRLDRSTSLDDTPGQKNTSRGGGKQRVTAVAGVREALEIIDANMSMAIRIAKKHDTEVATVFIEIMRMGLDCRGLVVAEASSRLRTPKNEDDEKEEGQKPRTRTRRTRSRTRAEKDEEEQRSLDDMPEALEDDEDDDLPF